MKDLKKLLFSSLSKKKISSVSKWAMINTIFLKYINQKYNLNLDKIDGKLENNVYIVKLPNSSLSNIVFIHKKQLLDYINTKLENMNLWKILDIKLL